MSCGLDSFLQLNMFGILITVTFAKSTLSHILGNLFDFSLCRPFRNSFVLSCKLHKSAKERKKYKKRKGVFALVVEDEIALFSKDGFREKNEQLVSFRLTFRIA